MITHVYVMMAVRGVGEECVEEEVRGGECGYPDFKVV